MHLPFSHEAYRRSLIEIHFIRAPNERVLGILFAFIFKIDGQLLENDGKCLRYFCNESYGLLARNHLRLVALYVLYNEVRNIGCLTLLAKKNEVYTI